MESFNSFTNTSVLNLLTREPFNFVIDVKPVHEYFETPDGDIDRCTIGYRKFKHTTEVYAMGEDFRRVRGLAKPNCYCGLRIDDIIFLYSAWKVDVTRVVNYIKTNGLFTRDSSMFVTIEDNGGVTDTRDLLSFKEGGTLFMDYSLYNYYDTLPLDMPKWEAYIKLTEWIIEKNWGKYYFGQVNPLELLVLLKQQYVPNFKPTAAEWAYLI